jgi:hypothetical protein
MSDSSPPPGALRAPRGPQLSCRHWLAEAALRMLLNNLDPEVAERPEELVVYGGIGKAARNWQCFHRIVAALRSLGEEETLLVQSGKPVGVFRTHADAPRVLIANSNLVARWADWEHFNELDRKGLMMFGQMTAGSWIYIGSQGIVQGTYETFVEMGRQHFGGNLTGRWILTAGLGGMGGAQPLAATMAGASMLAIECRPERIAKRLQTGYLDVQARSLDEALELLQAGGPGPSPGRRDRSPSDCSEMPARFCPSCYVGASGRTPSPIRPLRTIPRMATCHADGRSSSGTGCASATRLSLPARRAPQWRSTWRRCCSSIGRESQSSTMATT